MTKSLKIYLIIIYSTWFTSFTYFWDSFNLKQILITSGFIILMSLFNSEVIKDLQSNITYIIVLPFSIPASVFLEPVYAMLFIAITLLIIYRKIIWYKRFFNATVFSLSISISSFFIHNLFENIDEITLFSPSFFILIVLLSFLYKLLNDIFVFIAASLEKGKFDIHTFITILTTTKSALITIFLGLINVILYYYTNLIGVAIFTFLVYFIKPALEYRQIFDNELSTYTDFVLHVLKQMDPVTHSHSERVKHWTVLLAEKMGLPKTEIRQLSQAASWHDIGKIEIPMYIIGKPGKLTDEEYGLIQSHPEKGYELVQNMHFFKSFLPVIRHHHEKYDGTGYPLGLKGDKIPMHARIMAITDAFDAMTSDRSYREGMPINDAVKEILKYSGTQFDPKIVPVFVEALQEKYGDQYEKFSKEVLASIS